MAKLSAFGDEVASELLGQVEYLVGEEIGYIEPRFINNKNILDLTNDELRTAKGIIEDHGLKVSAIGSPIGKVRLDEPFESHLDRFKHAIELALFLGTPFIRVFSYYAPQGRNIDDCRDQVLQRIAAQVELLKDVDIILVHENEAHTYGHMAEHCVELVEAMNSPKLRLAYDSANFVVSEGITNNIEVCWPLMKPYVVHVHIKDWKLGAKDVASIPGEGDAQIRELLAELAAVGYDGCLTLEPHLQEARQIGGFTGPTLFSKAIAAVRKLTEEVGLPCD